MGVHACQTNYQIVFNVFNLCCCRQEPTQKTFDTSSVVGCGEQKWIILLSVGQLADWFGELFHEYDGSVLGRDCDCASWIHVRSVRGGCCSSCVERDFTCLVTSSTTAVFYRYFVARLLLERYSLPVWQQLQ